MYRVKIEQRDGTVLELLTEDPGSTVTSIHREFMPDDTPDEVFDLFTCEAFKRLVNAIAERQKTRLEHPRERQQDSR